MIWPFMLRSTHEATTSKMIDAMLKVSNGSLEELRAERAADRRRFDELLEKYTMLRLQGFDYPPAAVAPVPQATAPADPVERAIREKAAGDRGLIRMMREQAAADRAAGVPAEEIARRIRSGVVADAEAFALDTPLTEIVGGPQAGVATE